MIHLRALAVTAACLALAAASARAQPVPPPMTADADNQVSELVVVAHPQGPAMWRVQVGDNTMVIIGAVTPMQQQQRWEQRPLFAALDGARLLLTSPKPDLGPVQILGLLTSNIWKVRQRQPLEPQLPADLRARVVAARTHAWQKEDRYAHWKPAVAGFLLLSDYRRSFGFSEGKPATTVEKTAKEMGVRVEPLGAYRLSLFMKVAARLDDAQQLACLRDTLDQMEYEGAHAQDLNDDWAKGDVPSVIARYRIAAAQRCLMLAPGGRELVEQEMQKAADRLWAELQKPGKTVAVVDMAWLYPQGGLLDRLKAKGAVVGPPPALRDVEG
jgi:hypothetical protein